MRKITLFISILIVACTANAQKETTQRIKTDIDSVTIYLTGAELHQSKSVKLAEGRNLLIFEGLSPRVNDKSVRVSTPEDVSLLAISTKINYLSKAQDNPRIQQIKDSVEMLNSKIKTLTDETDALKVEKEMLLKNTSLGGANNGVVLNDLKGASDFFRQKITEINLLETDKNKKILKFKEVVAHMSNELSELNAQYTYERMEISVLVATDKATTANIQLKYLVGEAGWSPNYDIKAVDITKPVQFVYRAKVYNNTNIDWKEVKIRLSTADPTLDVSKPILNTWFLNFNNVYSQNKRSSYQNEGYMQNQNLNDALSGKLSGIELQSNAYQWTTTGVGTAKGTYNEVEVPELSAEFDIKTKYTIPSDAKEYIVDVVKQELPAIFQHYAVTKLDKDVFLLARITGWEDLNLIEGPANVYYAGTYIGESHIRTRSVNDTLDISLGRDSKVLVTRTKLKDYSSKQFMGSKITDVRVYELVAKNNRKTPIELEILDQIPVSQTAEIEVKLLEAAKAEYNVATGELRWTLKLQPGQSEKMKLSFSMKYPKDRKQDIQLERTRKMYMK